MSSQAPLTRYEGNPIIRPEDVPGGCHSVFNSAVVRFGGGYAGVFRVEGRDLFSRLHRGRSADGIAWQIEAEPIRFECDESDFASLEHTYDPRVTQIEDRYYITYANHDAAHGSRIGLAVTEDFETFRQIGNLSAPNNRNAVLFPERIGGVYARLERPFAAGGEPAEIWYAESPDLIHWGRFRFCLGPRAGWAEYKVGAGPPPIRTPEGWLLIYHGIRRTYRGDVYCAGAALLDLEEPWKVVARPAEYLLAPSESYERAGDVPNVVFPSAAVVEPNGEVKVYYGAADSCVALATGQLADLVAFCRGQG